MPQYSRLTSPAPWPLISPHYTTYAPTMRGSPGVLLLELHALHVITCLPHTQSLSLIPILTDSCVRVR